MYVRDSRKPLELNAKALRTLIEEMERIYSSTFNDDFSDTVNNLMGILREKYLIHETIPNNKRVKRILESYRDSLAKTLSFQNMGMDIAAFNHLQNHLPQGVENIVTANEAMLILQNSCETAINTLSERKQKIELDFQEIKQVITTELARALATSGVRISTTRGGKFEQCVRAFYGAFNGEADGKKFNMYPRDDIFALVQKAKDNHQNTEPYILLNFK